MSILSTSPSLGEAVTARDDLLLRARASGANPSPLLLGRCLWRAGRTRDARVEFERALAGKEAPAFYLERCIEALRATP